MYIYEASFSCEKDEINFSLKLRFDTKNNDFALSNMFILMSSVEKFLAFTARTPKEAILNSSLSIIYQSEDTNEEKATRIAIFTSNIP